MSTVANITWGFVPGSLSTKVEYKLSTDVIWIQPVTPTNPTTGNIYPITIEDDLYYDIRLTTNASRCTPRSRTFRIIHMGTNCCPSGYTLSDDQTYCYKINDTAATGPTSPENSVATVNVAYSTCGSYIYSTVNPNGTGTSSQISLSNPFWKNGGTCANNNTVDGPLNRSGLWSTTVASNQDIGFGVCIDVPETKTYYIGIGCDNYAKVNIDGTNFITQNETAVNTQYSIVGACFKVWHIYPVVLSGGITHYLELIGHNVGGAAGLGAEIYNNTAAEIAAITGYSDPTLNLVFSTKDYRGQPIQLGSGGIGYSCPSGYSAVFCEGPVFCRQVLTTSIIPCGTTTTTTTTTSTTTTTTTT